MIYLLSRALRYFLCSLFLLLPISFAYSEQHLEVLTENWPPFNYEKEGEVVGFATEIVKATLDNAGLAYTIRLGVWKGIYDKVLSQNDVLVYTITRTKERENLFDWIGPFAKREQSLFKLKSRQDIKIDKLDDARKYLIGLQEGDAITNDLIQNGFSEEAKNLYIFDKRILAYRSLFAGRVDLVTGHDITVKYQLALEDLPYDEVEKAYEFDVKSGFYMAFKKNSNPELVAQVRAGFEELKASDQLNKIVQKYH